MQFQLDAETLSESLNRLSSTLDPKSLANKSNPEVLMALEVGHCSLLTGFLCIAVLESQEYGNAAHNHLGHE